MEIDFSHVLKIKRVIIVFKVQFFVIVLTTYKRISNYSLISETDNLE